jgi:hypothetical protein
MVAAESGQTGAMVYRATVYRVKLSPKARYRLKRTSPTGSSRVALIRTDRRALFATSKRKRRHGVRGHRTATPSLTLR